MTKRTELDRPHRDFAKAVLAELTPKQERFFEREEHTLYGFDIWIGEALEKASDQVKKKARTCVRTEGHVSRVSSG